MDKLSPDAFFTKLDDVERRHWELQAMFRDCYSYFHANKLYPQFGRVVKLYRALQTVLTRRQQFLDRLPTYSR